MLFEFNIFLDFGYHFTNRSNNSGSILTYTCGSSVLVNSGMLLSHHKYFSIVSDFAIKMNSGIVFTVGEYALSLMYL